LGYPGSLENGCSWGFPASLMEFTDGSEKSFRDTAANGLLVASIAVAAFNTKVIARTMT